ncbi:hypothetical protein D9611_005550 [Ephemerocybe angulata]|uniref:Aminoglycoside phosphotransferase domain-containing protein n=1 Tax=Ephemerocybe angulata TaxID=980116 RepID=A0A8H5F4T1_9AGAR|nr:hypothetical protein D9611_005550 [Tulosesus angulatus]
MTTAPSTSTENPPADTLSPSSTHTTSAGVDMGDSAAPEGNKVAVPEGSASTTHTSAPLLGSLNTRVGDQSESEYDLTTEDGVRSYLAETPFASARVETLSGGSANYVYRLWLESPLEGEIQTAVLKHTKPYVREFKHVAFTDERQVFEVEALKRVASWVPKDSLVQVPRVHKFDYGAHAIIMDDAGEGSVTLKEFMKQGGPTVDMAVQIGKGIGEFLGSVHAWGTANRAELEVFQGHTQGKVLGARYYYGRLANFFSGKSGEPKLEDPPLLVDDATLAVLKEVGEETSQALQSANDHFVQGDFWPGNMLVALDKEGQLKRILVVDWEMARIGIPGVEVGQFAAEIYFCGRFHEDVCKETSKAVLDNFFAAYSAKFDVTDELARRALVHFGTHLAVVGPTVGWGPKDISREVALEGAKIIAGGHNAELALLKESAIGGLLNGR